MPCKTEREEVAVHMHLAVLPGEDKYYRAFYLVMMQKEDCSEIQQSEAYSKSDKFIGNLSEWKDNNTKCSFQLTLTFK